MMVQRVMSWPRFSEWWDTDSKRVESSGETRKDSTVAKWKFLVNDELPAGTVVCARDVFEDIKRELENEGAVRLVPQSQEKQL